MCSHVTHTRSASSASATVAHVVTAHVILRTTKLAKLGPRNQVRERRKDVLKCILCKYNAEC